MTTVKTKDELDARSPTKELGDRPRGHDGRKLAYGFLWSSAARAAVLVGHAALLIALPFWAGRVGVLLALPLLFPVRGLWRGRVYTYAWCSLLITIYLGGFLMEAFSTAAAPPQAMILAVAAALEFSALLLFVRFKAAEQRATAT